MNGPTPDQMKMVRRALRREEKEAQVQKKTYFNGASTVLILVPSSGVYSILVASAEATAGKSFSSLIIVSGIKVIPAPFLCKVLDKDKLYNEAAHQTLTSSCTSCIDVESSVARAERWAASLKCEILASF